MVLRFDPGGTLAGRLRGWLRLLLLRTRCSAARARGNVWRRARTRVCVGQRFLGLPRWRVRLDAGPLGPPAAAGIGLGRRTLGAPWEPLALSRGPLALAVLTLWAGASLSLSRECEW